MSEPANPSDIDETVRPRVQSAARAVAILVAVAQSENGLTTRQISDELGISRQAVYHLLHTLIGAGMLTRVDENRIMLGLGVGTLARGFEQQLSPAEHLAPLVRDLSQETDETSYAAGWRLGEITVHAVARGSSAVQAAETPRGFTGFAHARASGKLLLAVASDAVRDEYLSTHPLSPVTANTITDRASLDEELNRIRDDGYATDNEEFAEGVCCMAVPLDGGHSPFVLSLSAPRDRFKENFDRNLDVMRKIASQVSNKLSLG